jgi:hypothetical protein
MNAQLTQIANGWQNVRREWFRVAVTTIVEDPARATHITQGGRAELAMRAYQLTDSIGYIASNSYVEERSLPELFQKLTIMLSVDEKQRSEILG